MDIDINYAVLSLFAIYGIMSILMSALKMIGRKKYIVNNANLVLLVHEQGQYIEGIVEEAMGSRFVRNIAEKGNFIVIDMNSKDETLKILRKLEYKYPLLEVCTFEEKDCIFYKE